MGNKVAILEPGAQLSKLIDRYVRELGVESEILPFGTSPSDLEEYSALIIAGGPRSVYEDGAPQLDSSVFEMNKPTLGICYGMQLINQHFGGGISNDYGEYGEATINIVQDSPFFKGLSTIQPVLMSHGDRIGTAADGFIPTAFYGNTIAAIENIEKRMVGTQFHPEDLDFTTNGKEMLSNFLFEIAELQADYTLDKKITLAERELKEAVGKKRLGVFVSGGLDSTVLAVLAGQTLDDVWPIYIDSGLMRRGETREIERLAKQIDLGLESCDYRWYFANNVLLRRGRVIGPLKQLVDAEDKRLLIGEIFGRMYKKAMINSQLEIFAQGTLRPDLIESGSEVASQHADKIKTHHNDTKIMRAFRRAGMLAEPFKELHKDEVREIGRELGLPDEILQRHPFPGPGLATRIICAQTPQLKYSKAAVRTLDNFGIEYSFLPIRTVGVKGDRRTYGPVIALNSSDMGWDELKDLSNQITGEIPGITRVIYTSNKLQDKIPEIKRTHMTHFVMGQARTADKIVTEEMHSFDVYSDISQLPVVLLPLSLNEGDGRTIVLRPVTTKTFMTAKPLLPPDIPQEFFDKVTSRILDEVKGIDSVAVDLTSKPPATIEWE